MLHRVGFVVSFSSNIELWFHKWFPQSFSTNYYSKQVLIGLALGVEGRPPAPLNLVTFSQFLFFFSIKELPWKLNKEKLAFSLAKFPHHQFTMWYHIIIIWHHHQISILWCSQVQVGGEEGVGHPAYVLSILSDLGTLIDQRLDFPINCQ